ncbi:potassium-transporting ATPase subunit KdpC [Cytobacillus oceanisediminis]|uniref:potassium-transporting ATPase subunit KdpC n=1 Tax=Cytobacillus oceanisediminis TaxID=665099 RepID=UPI0023DC0C09|nr:potassium-transporting ATPase subunit KdpC [Cytobacillus oceanisediminis]MDF2036455.1 potassium-transporting ATPase subunit KdpC [Cytobacillus oceanisediminis]
MQGLNGIVGPIVRISFVIMLVGGLLYPLAVTGIAQAIMPDRADGSLIYNEKNEVIGSELIGQSFTSPEYFHGRVSSIEYDGAGSGSNNYAPSNQEMIDRTKDSVEAWKEANPSTPINEVPIDLVTNSGSGLDPHISPEAAYAQVGRISELTGIDQQALRDLIEKHTEGKELGLFGEERVNVLKLNLDLKELL